MGDQEITQDTYDKLSVLVESRDFDGASRLLKDRFTQLPEDVQGGVLTLLLAEAIEMESVALDETLAIQKEGIAALKALEELRTAILV